MSHPLRLASVALWLMLLTACSAGDGSWQLRNISGLMPDLAFELTDGDGHLQHAEDSAGKIRLLYFGYTHCPDVCPTTLAQIAQVLRKLGDQARQIRVLFVSVDPARDTPGVLKAYAHAFAPQLVGLRGNPSQLTDITRRYRVSYGLGKPDANGRYAVSHSSAIFIFDGSGAVRLLATQEDSSEALESDLRQLLAESQPR